MSKATFNLMTENALTYLRLAPSDWANKPDQFAIKVYTAIELFLKARLLREHWSLIITRDPTLKKFQSGDFVSVAFEEAAKRLEHIVDEPLPKDAFNAFNELRKYRNQVVHFGLEGEGGIDALTARQTITRKMARDAWNELQKLIHGKWRHLFEDHISELDRIESTMERHSQTVGFDGKFRGLDIETPPKPPTDWFKPLATEEEIAEEDRKLEEEDKPKS